MTEVREITAADQRARVVRLSQRPPPRPVLDCRWAPLAIPSSSGAESGPSRQPPSVSTLVRAGYGAGRDVSACPAKADGSCANLDHHAVRADGPRTVGTARPAGQAAQRALGSRRFRNPANRRADSRPARLGSALPLGEVARPAAITPR